MILVPTIEQTLTEVARQLDELRMQGAFTQLKSSIDEVSDYEIQTFKLDLEALIARFHPKKRQILATALADRSHHGVREAKSLQPKYATPRSLGRSGFRSYLDTGFEDLSRHHIFQWSTYYRDFLKEIFDKAVKTATDASEFDTVRASIAKSVQQHSQEIFSKGYDYVRNSRQAAHDYAVSKSLAGLKGFLDLPLELYSVNIIGASTAHVAQSVRAIASAMIRGILSGFRDAEIAEGDFESVHRQHRRTWIHLLVLLTREDFEALVSPDEYRYPDGLDLAPIWVLAQAIESASQRVPDYPLAVSLAQFSFELRRVDISLLRPVDADDASPLEVTLSLSQDATPLATVEDAIRRQQAAVVFLDDDATLNWQLRIANANAIAAPIPQARPDLGRVAMNLAEILELAVRDRRGSRVGSAPLRFNVARQFPLHNPRLLAFFRVQRPTVQTLLKTLSRRTGVRLWCSVRRSGKTTSCIELEGSSDLGTVLSQTCDSTDSRPDSGLLYNGVVAHIESGTFLPNTFVTDIITRCTPPTPQASRRYVLILDEYERLFATLALKARKDPETKYTVAQPLLDQLVAFSRDNLFVMLGQQPNAHFIFMDQNSLSAYVEQDPFPLFQHEAAPSSTEFANLLRKALTDRLRFDDSFSGSIYRETSGHPFLTVNLLTVFVEWLIDRRFRAKESRLNSGLFDEFAREGLSATSVSLCREYEFFRYAAAEALGNLGREQTPWLHAVYNALQFISRESPTTLKVSRGDFASLTVGLTGTPGLVTTEDLLSTAARSNFLQFDENWVWPKICLLARICRDVRAVQ